MNVNLPIVIQFDGPNVHFLCDGSDQDLIRLECVDSPYPFERYFLTRPFLSTPMRQSRMLSPGAMNIFRVVGSCYDETDLDRVKEGRWPLMRLDGDPWFGAGPRGRYRRSP